MDSLIVEHGTDRTIVRLERPRTLNSIDQTMVDELHTVCAQLELEPRVLIVTGTRTERGGIFASGADISQLRDRRRHDALRGINSSIFARIAALPMPVIAAIDGYALGGGAELAYAADFRIATTRVKIGNPEPNLGIIAAAGGCWRLMELVGEPVAKEILLAGRVLSADEALSIRLVSEVCEPDELLDRANALADRISGFDPLAVQVTKQVIHAPRAAHPVIDNLAQALLFESPEKAQRMDDFIQKRDARKGR
ncbi:enoyl-CoA hydratase/isomerase family protein [Gulosibacter molinativorax]|uniref:Enoyl-CoA hydratase/isomerase family protein n=1 Tax=Gulosibacter molinativorax TaxID=256821 RepID=A0ABT7C4T6_9MICO|nr:enoyl-CoA hydratase/isomerase family protein [Gulosibacter molinativorax]MDJ1370210.1 enoyl-CoA hydratase/isomerase family protein [Gulosibacter molinativorax]QUY61623.1 Putative enoyl-CoA hydratase PaaA [Gulosibacter molinativorax]